MIIIPKMLPGCPVIGHCEPSLVIWGYDTVLHEKVSSWKSNSGATFGLDALPLIF
jgi:hypothetical protein